MLIFKVVYEFRFAVLVFGRGTEVAFEDEGIKHMFIGNVNLLFYVPGLSLAVGASIISISNDLKISVAKYSLAFLALSRIVKRNAIADRTGDEFNFKKGIFGHPFLIDCYELRLADRLIDDGLFFASLLHMNKYLNITIKMSFELIEYQIDIFLLFVILWRRRKERKVGLISLRRRRNKMRLNNLLELMNLNRRLFLNLLESMPKML